VTGAAVAIVLAAGQGERVGAGHPKAFLPIAGVPLVSRAVSAAAGCPLVGAVVVAAPAGWEERARALLAGVEAPLTVVTGGADRQASVRSALDAVGDDVALVAVHDAARCFASSRLFSDVLAAVEGEVAGAIPVVAVPDTVKRVEGRTVVETVPRDDLALAQTPQAFAVAPLRVAHERAVAEGLSFTDDAGLVEWAGGRVVTVPGETGNVKLTTADDLARAEVLVREGAYGDLGDD
jgi:2-C-methyl-D-erythritol 4-phosphate cytidylyltransferase/2-C-methyl-D-erythritol 2,4-cyclodiphosphate synthase